MQSLFKRLGIFFLFGLSVSTPCFAASNQFWAVDPVSRKAEAFQSDRKKSALLPFNNKPLELRSLPEQKGYLLLCQGITNLWGGYKSPGSLIYLNSSLQPTGSTVKFNGIVTHQVFLKHANLWLITTANRRAVTLHIFNFATGTQQQFSLEATPNAYQLNQDESQLAMAINPVGTHTTSEILLIDLKKLTSKTFQVGMNSGAIYFISPTQLFVASGGFRDSQKYLGSWKMQTATEPVPGKLQTIDTVSGQISSIGIGSSPIIITQDSHHPDTFYCSSYTRATPEGPISTLHILQNGKIIAALEIPENIREIVQADSGNLCILGKTHFYLVNPQTATILSSYASELSITDILLNSDGQTGYLLISNSHKIPVIDLRSGETKTTIQVAESSILDTFKFFSFGDTLLGRMQPPVISDNPVLEDLESDPQNQKILFDPKQNRLFLLTGKHQISVVDLKTNQIEREIQLSGPVYGFGQVPGSTRMVAITEYAWDLIDPEQKKPLLSVRINNNDTEHEKFGQKGYYSPDGSLLVVPFLNQLYLIDTEKAEFLGKIHTRFENPVILWP